MGEKEDGPACFMLIIYVPLFINLFCLFFVLFFSIQAFPLPPKNIRIKMWLMLAQWLLLRRFVTRGFTINTGPDAWSVSLNICYRRGKNGRGSHFVFNVLLKQSTAVMPAFFSMSDKKRGEMEREGSGGEEVGWAGMGGGGCWHALVSNLFECIAQFICFVSTATAEDNQTRRPLDTSYCPPLSFPPFPHAPSSTTSTPVSPVFLPQHCFFFFFSMWHADWRRQGNSQASPKWGKMSGREPTSKPCCHGDTVWSRIYRRARSHSQDVQNTNTHAGFYVPQKINMVAFFFVVVVLVSLWTKEKQ